MADNTNVNNNAAVVVVGRTAPVPPGQQTSDKSIPVVIASDQATIPVAEQNKIQSEVALSLLGIPRSEVALGIFADVNTYDVNPSEWASSPEQYSEIPATGIYAGISTSMGWGLTHVPEEAGALIEAPADKVAVLTSKRFFRYQPGRVSSATFGVKTTLNSQTNDGSDIYNPSIRKYGIFDNYDGYYWESRNNGEGDNFCVVRRTQSLIYENPVTFGTGVTEQSQDYGRTNPFNSLAPRGSESEDDPTAEDNPKVGGKPKKFGDLVILRDNLLMTHAAVYDPSLLQNETQVEITSTNSDIITIAGLAKTVTNAVYNIDTGLMVITTSTPHGYEEGKFVTLTGIGMTCDIDPVDIKYYPNRTPGYNVLSVPSTTSFTVNIGISTVPTFYNSGGHVVGLSTDQYVSYSKGTNASEITGFTDGAIYRVSTVGVNTLTGISTVTLRNLNGSALTGISNVSGISSHVLITPVPFIHPTNDLIIGDKYKYGYSGVKTTGMFPYLYEDPQDDANTEGYIDTTIPSDGILTLKSQIDAVNDYYRKWVNQSVKKEYWNVYEYRVPRSRFSGDRLDGETQNLLYSDVISDKRPGQLVRDENTQEILQDTSIWDIDLTKVTMYKVEFSWYGAVGALFLAYVPVSNGEARWVRVHHLRASNQLKVASLGNATLPITYLVYGGGSEVKRGYLNSERLGGTTFGDSYGSPSEHIIKYGASYYIDGGDRGTVKLFSYATENPIDIYGSKRSFSVGAATTQVGLASATSTDPTGAYITAGSATGLATSFYVGSKVITTDPLDQNIQITYVNPETNELFLNSPLNSSSSPTITIIPNRSNPLIGLKCRDFIQSSTGKSVRNRTQIYPTRLSTGSTGLIKIDLIKSPVFQTTATTTGTFTLLTPDLNIGKRGKPTSIPSLSNSSYLASGTGVYGYFRAYYKLDPTQKLFSVLGYLENRGTDGYYFYALQSTTDDIVLSNNYNFLKEENVNSVGTSVSSTPTEFTLDKLSSVKVSLENRSPIPGTGVVVSTIFVPASGAEYDLSPFFDYNKEYLSFPLTDKVDSLYICATSQTNYDNALPPSAVISASITWEEQ